jgi:hypothetical protein
MSRIAPLLKKMAAVAVTGLFVLTIAATDKARADPCVQQCRAEHNACRMATKLLSSPYCDAQLQGCISHCFAGDRQSREPREPRDGHGPRDRR